MSIKRVICLLTAFSLIACFLTVSSAAAESSTVAFSLRDDGEEIFLETTLLPEGRITVTHPEGTESGALFALIGPEALPEILEGFRGAVTALNGEKAEIRKGLYAGDLFDQATEQALLTLSAEEAVQLAGKTAERMREAGSAAADGAEALLKAFVKQVFDNETKACISTYDTDRYITIEIERGGEILMTLSADLWDRDALNTAICRGAGGAAYYETIRCNRNEAGIEYLFDLYRTTAPSLRMVRADECVQSGSLRISSLSGGDYDFEGELQTALLPSAAGIRGSRRSGADGKGRIDAEMAFEGETDSLTYSLLTILYSLAQP